MPTEGNFNVGRGPLFDSATSAWVDAVVANGGSVSAGRQTIVDALIRGLKADVLFSKLDRLWLFAAENQPSALTDIINDQLAITVSSPTFTVDDGYTGGDPTYIDSNVDPSTAGGNYTLNSACAFAWSISSAQNVGAVLGGIVGRTRLFPRFTDNNAYWRINDINADIITASTDASGFWTVAKTVAATQNLYRNGSLFDSQPVVGNQISTSTIFLKTGATGADSYTGQCACGGFGGGLDTTDVLNLYSRLRTYMTAVGVP